MSIGLSKLISLFISFCLILEQSVFAQSLDLSAHFANFGRSIAQTDKFRPLHLRYLGYDNLKQDFKLLLDKGDTKNEDLENKAYLEENTQTLLKYFFIGLSLPNDKFWVNLRPDSPDNILDPDLERTDIGRIFLEADLQLKKDTAQFTSPQTKEGKEYWDKLYKKAGELFGSENITIPTITRPWIVPNEIIIREAPDNGSTALTTSAYIYKATLKVMLEEDYLQGHTYEVREPHLVGVESVHSFSDPRLKELNQYSTQLIKEQIIPKLTFEVNTSKRYAPLRQVYYSLILAQWFKQRYKGRFSESSSLFGRTVPDIDSRDLTNLTSQEPYDKQTYFKQYQKSFQDGEYNLSEPTYTLFGQSIRKYMSGGMQINCSSAITRSIAGVKDIPNCPFLIPLTYTERYVVNSPNSSSTLNLKKIALGVILSGILTGLTIFTKIGNLNAKDNKVLPIEIIYVSGSSKIDELLGKLIYPDITEQQLTQVLNSHNIRNYAILRTSEGKIEKLYILSSGLNSAVLEQEREGLTLSQLNALYRQQKEETIKRLGQQIAEMVKTSPKRAIKMLKEELGGGFGFLLYFPLLVEEYPVPVIELLRQEFEECLDLCQDPYLRLPRHPSGMIYELIAKVRQHDAGLAKRLVQEFLSSPDDKDEWLNILRDVYERAEDPYAKQRVVEIEQIIQTIEEENTDSSSPLGGVDLGKLNIYSEKINSSPIDYRQQVDIALSLNIDTEYKQIEKLHRASFRPAIESVVMLILSSCSSPADSQYLQSIRQVLIEMFRDEELRMSKTLGRDWVTLLNAVESNI